MKAEDGKMQGEKDWMIYFFDYLNVCGVHLRLPQTRFFFGGGGGGGGNLVHRRYRKEIAIICM